MAQLKTQFLPSRRRQTNKNILTKSSDFEINLLKLIDIDVSMDKVQNKMEDRLGELQKERRKNRNVE